MTPHAFIAKWRASELKERSASQEHFLDLCRLLDEPTPAEADPTGETYCFERGARKDTGGDGWADVWKRHHFAWEYKGQRADLDAAFGQLRQYALALENPPLLIVSDMVRFRIRTNWTNSVSRTHEFELDDLADAATRDRLKWAFADPERLRPGGDAAVADGARGGVVRVGGAGAAGARARPAGGGPLRQPARLLHVRRRRRLLPGHMFTRMLRHAHPAPERFPELAGELFRVMASGGRVGFEAVAWFNGGLFDDGAALPLEKSDIETLLAASDPDWSEIDPSILGTLFERGLDPGKRAQLGAHYTDREKILQLVEPVVVRPLLAEWEREKAAVAAELERAEAARSRAARMKRRNEAERRYRAFLTRLREFTVLDPAWRLGELPLPGAAGAQGPRAPGADRARDGIRSRNRQDTSRARPSSPGLPYGNSIATRRRPIRWGAAPCLMTISACRLLPAYCGRLRVLIRRLHCFSVDGTRAVICARSRSSGFTCCRKEILSSFWRAASPTRPVVHISA